MTGHFILGSIQDPKSPDEIIIKFTEKYGKRLQITKRDRVCAEEIIIKIRNINFLPGEFSMSFEFAGDEDKRLWQENKDKAVRFVVVE